MKAGDSRICSAVNISARSWLLRNVCSLIQAEVQVNFLVLLLIEATSNIHELYFTFPPLLQSNVTSEPECVDSPTGIAPITWILMPFYYLPLLVLTVVACVYLALYMRYTSVASLFSCFVSKQSDTLQCCRQVSAWAALPQPST